MEKLTVKNFGGIKEEEFEFRAINILIGPQASGKSVTVKLMYFFKNFFDEIFKSVQDQVDKRKLDSRQKEKFYNYFPRDSWGKGAFKLKYSIGEDFISMERKGELSVDFKYSQAISLALGNCKRLFKKLKNEGGLRLPNLFYQRQNVREEYLKVVSSKFSKVAGFDQFFVPAGRSFFSNLQSSIFSFLSENRSLDPFLVEFGAYYEDVKELSRLKVDKPIKSHLMYERIISEILNGVYSREKNKDFLVHPDSRKVNLAHASSGQQETLPLLLVLRSMAGLGPVFYSPFDGSTLYIEEPEAHLFPTAQKRVVQLMARTFNSRPNGFQYFITTHSPYILSSFNNLIEAGAIRKGNPNLAKDLEKIVPEAEQLDIDDFAAYSLYGGKKTNIIDQETGLIGENLLDAVSNDIAIEFGNLLDLAY